MQDTQDTVGVEGFEDIEGAEGTELAEAADAPEALTQDLKDAIFDAPPEMFGDMLPEGSTDFREALVRRALTDPDIIFTPKVKERCAALKHENPYLFAGVRRELLVTKKFAGGLGGWERSLDALHRTAEVDARRKKVARTFVYGSQLELARAVLEDLRVNATEIVYDRAQPWRYSTADGIWESLGFDYLRSTIMEYEGSPVIQGGGGGRGEPRVTDLIVSHQMACSVQAIIVDKLSSRGDKFFEGAVPGITFSNCFVRVTHAGEIKVEDHSPEQRSTCRLNFPYVGWDATQVAKMPKFLTAMGDWFKGDPDVGPKTLRLQEIIGLFLIGKASAYSTALVLQGEGSNGKSTLCQIVEDGLFEGMVSHVTPQDMSNEYRLAMLAKARLNSVGELPNRTIVNADIVKNVISGDSLTAREIREAPFNFRSTCGNMFACNNLPTVTDSSLGWWRRWTVITFNNTFGVEHGGSKATVHLGQQIIDEEIAAVSAWFLEGGARVIKQGFTDCPSSTLALRAWKESSDSVADFVTERCNMVAVYDAAGARIPKSGTIASIIYREYAATWCLSVGEKPASMKEFGKRIRGLAKLKELPKDSSIVYPLVLLPRDPQGAY